MEIYSIFEFFFSAVRLSEGIAVVSGQNPEFSTILEAVLRALGMLRALSFSKVQVVCYARGTHALEIVENSGFWPERRSGDPPACVAGLLPGRSLGPARLAPAAVDEVGDGCLHAERHIGEALEVLW